MKGFRQATLSQLSFALAAATIGIISVAYARLISVAQATATDLFSHHVYWVAAMPFAFVLASLAVAKLAPEARGSGIPQVMQAIEAAREHGEGALQSSLVSMRTALVKTLSTTIGIAGGASVGREGPTVQIAASVFAWVGRRVKGKGAFDARSYLVAGAAAGVAAAFNTPLAGITFAIEEIAEEVFGQFKQSVIYAVVVAGLVAEAIAGDYLYFGHPSLAKIALTSLPTLLFIAVASGLLGGFFSRVLAFPVMNFLPKRIWLRAISCGLICAGLALLCGGQTLGTGYEVTRQFMDGTQPTLPLSFPLTKLAATLFSYLSGMAGGIFAPSLAIGAGIGSTLGQLVAAADLKTCALVGMTAFFAGTVQAPLTAVVIVMEMTDQQAMVFYLLLSAAIAYRCARLLMPQSLYRYWAESSFLTAETATVTKEG